MRTLTASFFMSLDGVVDSPQHWHFPYQDDAMTQVVRHTMDASDTILLGRATYEEWVGFWPNRSGDGAMADFINDTPKLVASTTLQTVEWRNTAVIKGDVADAVERLKAEPGKDIWVNGSGTLVRCLLRADLVDELRLLLHPIVVGRGKHLFEEGGEGKGLELVSSERFPTGVLDLTYRPARR